MSLDPVAEAPRKASPVLSGIEDTPFRREGLRERIGAFALVALAAEASLALPPGPVSTLDTILSIGLLVVSGLMIALLPWGEMAAWTTVIVPVTYAGSVLLLILAAGGPTSGVGIVILIALVWTALYQRRWESAVVVAAIVLLEIVISVTPLVDHPTVIVRRVVFWGVLGLVVSFAIQGLRERLSTTFTEREELYDARAEDLRRVVALELAAEELTSTLDPLEVVGTASRLAAELVSLTGSGLHRAGYVRVSGGFVQLTAQHDDTGPDVTASYALSEHPRLEQAILTGEVSHGALDVAALGPTVRPLMEMLDITHCVYVPVTVGGDVGGALVISMRGTEAPPELVEQCKTLGRLTELALANALSHDRERDLATTDALTGLANRRSFDQLMVHRPGRGAFAAVVIDVDGLKEVNDAKGHLAGDALLRAVATALGGVMRRGDVLARVGGDEFAVLSFESDLEGAQEIARRMLQALRQTTVGGSTPRASIGVAAGGFEDDTIEIFHAADAAMYRAKHHGGGRFGVAEPMHR